MTPKPIVIYHRGCWDGFTSAWVWRKFRGEEADFVGAIYGEDPPDVKGRDVWIVDFSYPRETLLEKVIIPSRRTLVFDHHKTAQADLDGILQVLRKKGVQRNQDQVHFDMTRSGAGMIYDYLQDELEKLNGRREPRPGGFRRWRLIDYVEDRDLWRFQHEHTKEVMAWVATQPFDFAAWDKLAEMCQLTPRGIPAVAAGKNVLAYIKNYGERVCAHSRREKIGSHENVPTVNAPYQDLSTHLNMLLEQSGAPFVAGYFRRADGKWQFSLRSTKDFDCSEVAKSFGGGGHAQASGFEVDKLPWG